MSLFKNIFKSNDSENEQPVINWVGLTETEQLDKIINLSNEKPVLIFKHSTRCGISRLALKNFERNYDIEKEELDLYFLDLLSFRNISGLITEKFSVQHQSPQAILISKGEVIYHDSHYGISIDAIKKAIQ